MEIFVAGAVMLMVLAVLGLVWAVISLALWLIFLPFQILGLALRGVAILFALPFLAIFAFVGFLVFGFGLVALALPLLPLAALIALIWWLARRSGAKPVTTPS